MKREKEVERIMKDFNCTREEAEDMLFDSEVEDGFKDNCFCDNTGYCCGISCSRYYKCKGQ